MAKKTAKTRPAKRRKTAKSSGAIRRAPRKAKPRPKADTVSKPATTRATQSAFLSAYIQSGGNVTTAAQSAGIHRDTHYHWLLHDRAYEERFGMAQVVMGDELEAEAIRRARDGYDEPVFYEGAVCGHKRKFSDGLMQVLLERFKPEQYRRKVDVTSGGEAVPVVNIQLDATVQHGSEGGSNG